MWYNRTTVEQRYVCPWGCEICQEFLNFTVKLKYIFNYVCGFLVVLSFAFKELTDDVLCRLANQRTARCISGWGKQLYRSSWLTATDLTRWGACILDRMKEGRLRDKDKWWAVLNAVMTVRFPQNGRNFSTSWASIGLRRTLVRGATFVRLTVEEPTVQAAASQTQQESWLRRACGPAAFIVWQGTVS